MENNGDYVLMKNIEELTRLKMKMDNSFERSNEADFNNNSWMAAHALDDYHRLKEKYDDFKEQTRKLIENVPKEKVLAMCNAALEESY